MEADGRIEQRMAFIGAGHMAEAIIRGLFDRGVVSPENIVISDISSERLDALRKQWGVTAAAGNAPAVEQTDIIVLAVKPQNIHAVLADIRPAVTPEHLVVSIAAGITTGMIEKALGGDIRVVRVMPNTPALVGKGASAYCLGSRAAEKDAQTADTLFSSIGVVYRVDEDQMDAVTALSGSGPAYFFFLTEAMLSAAAEMGLPDECARELAAATCEGAGALLRAADVPPEALRRRVTSKGGTTAAAVAVLEEAGVRDAVRKALRAAEARSRELSSGKP